MDASMRQFFLALLLVASTMQAAMSDEPVSFGNAPMAAAAMPILATKSKEPRQGAILMEQFERASDGARFFVQWRSDEADPSIETRMDYSRSARQVIDLLNQSVPDRSTEVAQRSRTMAAHEYALTNYQREDGLVVSVFQLSPRLQPIEVTKGFGVCRVNPGLPPGNGDIADFEGQVASAAGRVLGSDNTYWDYTANWVVMRANGALNWVAAGGKCTRTDPQPITPPPLGGGNEGGHASSDRDGGEWGARSGVTWGKFWSCGSDGGTGIVCRPLPSAT